MSHNTWIHRLVRPLVEPLVDSSVTPNQVTTLRLILGLSASAACMTGGQTWIGIGGLLFLISVLLDRADGTLARLSGKKSRFGHLYDLVSDAVCNAMMFVGLGIGLRDGPLGSWTTLLGVLAGLAVGAILLMVVWAERQEGERAAELPNVAGFDADDGMVVVPIALWLGWALPLLYLAASIAPLFALFFAWKHRRFLVRPSERANRAA
jgi:phosphatidylglycerophosphate synthase